MQQLFIVANQDSKFLYFIRYNPRYVLGIYRKEVSFEEVYDEYRFVTHQTFGDKMEQVGQICSIIQMLF